MTLNQVVQRIKALALKHKQLKSFGFGDISEFLNDKETKYGTCFLQDSPGTIDPSGRFTNFNFKLFILDIVADGNKEIELEVQSDMLSIAHDLIALLDSYEYQDWKLSATPFTLVRDEYADVVAGVAADLSISVVYVKDKCAVPKNGPFLFEDVFNKEMP